jgi:hypothetical protein
MFGYALAVIAVQLLWFTSEMLLPVIRGRVLMLTMLAMLTWLRL